MDGKKTIKKAVSLAVLSALVQNNQVDGWSWNNLNPVNLVDKVNLVTWGKETKLFQWGKRGAEIYFGSAFGTNSKPEEGLVALDHMFNSCWVNTVFSCLMSQIIKDIEKIEKKLEEYTNEWEITTNDKQKQEQSDILNDSMGLLRSFIKDIKEVRDKQRKKLSKKLQIKCGYDGIHGGNPFNLLERLKPALKYCGFEVELAYWKDVPKKVKELENGGCRKYNVLIDDKEPNGCPHVYCEYIDLDKGKYYEINDMTGSRYQGYVKELDSCSVQSKISEKGCCVFAIMPQDQMSELKVKDAKQEAKKCKTNDKTVDDFVLM